MAVILLRDREQNSPSALANQFMLRFGHLNWNPLILHSMTAEERI
jgi:hypothetical protein